MTAMSFSLRKLLKLGAFFTVLMMVLPYCLADEEAIKQAIDQTDLKLKQSATAQRKINRLDDSTQGLLAEYGATLRELDVYRQYNEQVRRLVDSQEQELEHLNRQLASIDGTKREIFPFLSRLVSALEQFIILDIPFLPEERETRLKRLKNNLDRSDISLAEKLRQIFEAYRIELDYGRTIEAYQANLDLNGARQNLHFLRVGRVGLFYLSLDQSRCGFWNSQTKAWESLADDYIHSISQGLAIAGKKLPPDLLRLPLPAPEVSQ